MASRPCRLKSKNRPILLDLSFSSFDLKPFTVFTDTVSCSSIFVSTLSKDEISFDIVAELLPKTVTMSKQHSALSKEALNM